MRRNLVLVSLPASLLASLLTLALGGCYGGIVMDPTALTRGSVLNQQAAVAAVNQYRARHGLAAVVIDPELTRAASYAALSNARLGRLSHDAGGSFDSRMIAAGFGRGGIAENLAAGLPTFDQAFAMWKSSPGHNTNLLNPNVRRIGIAHSDVPGSRYGRFWAMEFAR